MRNLLGEVVEWVLLLVIPIDSNSFHFLIHACIAHEGAGLFAIETIGAAPFPESSRSKGGQIKTHEIAAADGRLHLFNVLFHFAKAVAIKTQLVHGLQHVWMNIITLETNMAVVTDEIGFAGEHLHQKIFRFHRIVNRKVDIRINPCGFNDLSHAPVCLVYGKGKVMRSSKKDKCLSAFDQFFCNRLHGGIGVSKGFSSFDVANVCDLDILVPEIKGVKFFSDLIDACKVSRVSVSPEVVATSNHNIGIGKIREFIFIHAQ